MAGFIIDTQGIKPQPVYMTFPEWASVAAAEIKSVYGDDIDILGKAKSLRKFGKTRNADTDVLTTVATFGSVGTPNVNETYSTTNDVTSVVSSSADDTETLAVEGHTINASGELTFVVQEVTLTGQTPVALGTDIARATRAYVKPSGSFSSPASDLVGDVYIYASEGVTVTAGVPQTNTAVKLRIVAGRNQSEKAATAISNDDYYIVTDIAAAGGRGNSSTFAAEIELEIRDVKNGGVFRPLGLEIIIRAGGSQEVLSNTRPYLIVPPNSDVRMTCLSNTDNATVGGFFNGFLATAIRP